MIKAAEADFSGFRGTSGEMQTKYQAVPAKVPASLVDIGHVVKRNNTLIKTIEENLMKIAVDSA